MCPIHSTCIAHQLMGHTLRIKRNKTLFLVLILHNPPPSITWCHCLMVLSSFPPSSNVLWKQNSYLVTYKSSAPITLFHFTQHKLPTRIKLMYSFKSNAVLITHLFFLPLFVCLWKGSKLTLSAGTTSRSCSTLWSLTETQWCLIHLFWINLTSGTYHMSHANCKLWKMGILISSSYSCYKRRWHI